MGSEPATAEAAPASLREARAVIPPHCYERSDRRAWLTLAQAAVLYLVPVLALAWVDAWWALLPLWLLAGLGIAGLFVLGHDASHGSLFTSPRRNRWAARLCMVPSAHVEAAWDLGHNRIHHGYTARQGFDFVWHPSTVDDYRELRWWQRARHRVEWSWFGAGLYYLRTVWWSKMIRFPGTERRRAEIRTDKALLGAAVAALLVATALFGWASAGVFGAIWMPLKLVVIPFLVFIHIIGFTVYVHHVSPDMRWWTRREWTQTHGQLESTAILRMPSLANRLWFHNIFVHVPHHLDARIPFHQLPAAATALLAAYPATVRQVRFRVRDYWRSARTCKLYDFDAGTWLPYPPAVTSTAHAHRAGARP